MLTACMLPLRMLGLLLLMLSLCDAHSICPDELNPLTLDVPKVIMNYGESVEVNCSSTEEDHDGIYWRIGNKDSEHLQDSFISQSVSLSEWNVTAECKINLNETHECSKQLEITIYQNPTVNVFSINTAVEGKLYGLQCDIGDVAPVQKLKVTWYKNNQTIRIENFTNTTKTPVSESSTLSVDISRADNGAEFRCEAQLDFGQHGPQLPVHSDKLIVSVEYAPEFKNTTEHVVVYEGENVTLNCDAEGQPKPTFHWTHDGKKLSDTKDLNIIRVNTNTKYNCSAKNYLGNITKEFHVYVSPRNIQRAPAIITTPEPSKPRDAHSICPDELNPLTLDVPKVIMNYGESVEVNCSSTEEDHDGIYWRIGNKDSEHLQDSFISQSVSLSEWNVTAECKINLNETHECSKQLEITIYQNPTVNVLSINTAVEGKLYGLQCDIGDVAPVQKLKVTWYKNNQTIRIENFTNTTKTPVSESSTLSVDISRADNGAEFRCEAQLDFGQNGPQLPVHSDKLIVSVEYAPEFKNTTEHVVVYEGENVTLNCDAEGQPKPTFHWTHDGKKLSDTNDLNIIRVNTNTKYNCSAKNYLGNITKEFHVYVSPRNIQRAPAIITTPEPSKPRGCPLVLKPAKTVVRFGDPASINCSTSATGIISVGWEATSGARITNGSAVHWSVDKVEDWNINLSCYLNYEENGMDHQCSVKPDITVYKTPDIVSLSAVNPGPVMEGTEHRLKCDIINVTPSQKLNVTWYRGTDILHRDILDKMSMNPVNMSSIFKFTAERDYNGANFRCEAVLNLGPNGPELVHIVTSSPYTAVVQYKPLIKDCPNHLTGVEHEFSLEKSPCQADGNPLPIFLWKYDGKMINANEPLTRTQSGIYTAEVSNSLGKSNTSVHITIEYGPKFTCNDHYEVQVNSTLQCELEGNPKPDIKWLKDGKMMASPWRWTKYDSGYYSLSATNKHGNQTLKLYIDVLFAPEINEGPYSKEVNLHGNVTLNCSAEGNPRPIVYWNYATAANVWNTTRGHMKSIIITGATYTNAGVYICVATNKVGSVKSNFTLTMKGERVFPLKFIWWLLIGLIVILVFIVIVYKRWKKHGRYSFIPHKDNDGSDIPMSPQSNGANDRV
ncbi:intercellular adhesion molecule 5 [Eleginops maclovinus]|uniref:intercellular adhesion molecule 5 n=1 Tax=Eleginops maclovinus TaxID=56733 RepID=UPI003080D4BF